MSLPAVTVIIATFNAEETLQACIDSIVEQDHPDFHLIIVDGGSTDGTLEILRQNEAHISSWTSGPDDGVFDAWNHGIAASHTPWVTFIGADDRFARPSSLSTMAAATTPEIDILFARNNVVNRQGRHLFSFGDPWDWKRMLRGPSITQPGCWYATSLFERFGPFNASFRLGSDYEHLLRIGPHIRTEYIPIEIVDFATGGISSQQRAVFHETRRIQAQHPQIGPVRAWRNFLSLYPRVAVGTMLGKGRFW